jgi:hypothetical protein
VDLSGVDPLKDALVAASDGKAGNALDQTLDALGAKLGEAQVSLAEVAAAMAANPASAAPLQTMLQPAASGCAWLKSGTYRILDLLEGSGRSDETLTLDAKALTVTHSDGTSEALADQGECHYTVAGVAAYVARSGAAIVHDPNGGERPGAPVMLIPEQTVAVSELAGTWNVFGHERGGEGEPWVPIAVTISFDASGKLTAGAECENFQVCTPWSDQNATVTPNPAGGFDLSDADGTSRLFAFKTPDGQLTLYVVGEYGFYVAARQQPQTLPAVGTERRTWDFFIGGNGIMSAPAATSRTVISVDAAAKSNTRLNQAEHRIDTWTADGFRNGISYRAANSMTIDGVVQQHAAAYSLSLPGVGISAIALPATKTFLFSASRP